MTESKYTLAVVSTPEDWEVYHSIRRQELFEAKGRIGIYDANRPEERAYGNFPLLLKLGGQGVGTTRLDVRPDGIAIIRLVAITKDQQGAGHGRVLADMVENLAREKGVKKLLVNANPNAVGYYEKLGYVREDWDPSELVGISVNSIQMSKILAAT
ncbi:MAG: GNAT family N-acetyltransferase [bacterium]|nr:GNAT family N-acetyltransferase [bacterium]